MNEICDLPAETVDISYLIECRSKTTDPAIHALIDLVVADPTNHAAMDAAAQALSDAGIY